MQCLNNLLLNTDSYKASHWLQYPPGTDATFFYVESRGGLYDRTLFYGLQAILKEYLAKPITHADVDEARDVFAAHGEPFNEAGWRHIIDRHGGHLPIRIRAVPRLDLRRGPHSRRRHPALVQGRTCNETLCVRRR